MSVVLTQAYARMLVAIPYLGFLFLKNEVMYFSNIFQCTTEFCISIIHFLSEAKLTPKTKLVLLKWLRIKPHLSHPPGSKAQIPDTYFVPLCLISVYLNPMSSLHQLPSGLKIHVNTSLLPSFLIFP